MSEAAKAVHLDLPPACVLPSNNALSIVRYDMLGRNDSGLTLKRSTGDVSVDSTWGSHSSAKIMGNAYVRASRIFKEKIYTPFGVKRNVAPYMATIPATGLGKPVDRDVARTAWSSSLHTTMEKELVETPSEQQSLNPDVVCRMQDGFISNLDKVLNLHRFTVVSFVNMVRRWQQAFRRRRRYTAAALILQWRWRTRNRVTAIDLSTHTQQVMLGVQSSRAGAGVHRAAAARYVQWQCRSRMWRAGRVSAAAVLISLAFMRLPPPATRCNGGVNLAGESDFKRMRQLSNECLDWYGQYVPLLRRLHSGVTPTVVQNFAGGGGSSEGVRRAGGANYGIDLRTQSDYIRRFGADNFVQMDGLETAGVRKLAERVQAVGCIAGPPCKFYSHARVRGESTEPPLISQTRDQMMEVFEKWAIENVKGAARVMSPNAVELRGSMFGLRVARARLYEANFPIVVDECIAEGARRLENMCCLGARSRFRRMDEFGRTRPPCCPGNIFTIVGVRPSKCTHAQCAAAMDVDVGAMSYERLAQSVPPAYSQLVFSQMCMAIVRDTFGAPAITFTEYKAHPSWAKSVMALWLRGAGGASPSLGLTFEKPTRAREGGVGIQDSNGDETARVGEDAFIIRPQAVPEKQIVGDDSLMFSNSADQLQQPSDGIPVQQPKASDSSIGRPSSLLDPELRDVHYSHAGDFSQQWMPVDRCGVLADVCEIRTLDAAPSVQQLRGNNTLLDMTQHGVGSVAMQLQELLLVREAGTRVTVLARACDEARLLEMGFENVPGIGMYSDAGSTRTRGILVMSAGQRSWAARAFTLSYEVARTHMDPRDQEGYEYNPEAKQAASWREMPWVPELWESVDLPPELSNAMCNGVQIKMGVGAIPAQMEQYAWPTGEALMHCVIETDRALHVGSMEYVPDDEVQHVLDTGIVHPWTVAMKPKPRACQDYSGGTNVWAHTAPFGLTNVWQAVKVVGPDSFFYKKDLRDGFWFVPVATRNLLVMRHPATGRLIRCNRLPFGFVDSPRIFCSLTEAIAQMLRARVAGWGAHVFCYCDNF